jgi:hypothetical protein
MMIMMTMMMISSLPNYYERLIILQIQHVYLSSYGYKVYQLVFALVTKFKFSVVTFWNRQPRSVYGDLDGFDADITVKRTSY